MLGLCWGIYYFVVSSAVYGNAAVVSSSALFERLIRSLIIAIALALVWDSIFTAVDYRFRNSLRPDWRRFVLWQGGLGYGLPFGIFMGVLSVIKENGLSLNAFLSRSALFEMCFSLVSYVLLGCLLGLIFFKMSESLRFKRDSLTDAELASRDCYIGCSQRSFMTHLFTSN